ncbi:hypothetical protein I4F81_006578 [Pyropia yezoensis]|uniref:Uncharacterized protein n=1 Tax=Pyropia yezoensis TaxID=2788 RepID=A0ACC3C2K2_PYRYE|nr:hypothetical protein I4F81_006578 [Neopyropia yezoensis]
MALDVARQGRRGQFRSRRRRSDPAAILMSAAFIVLGTTAAGVWFLQRPAALALYIPGVLFTFVGLALVTDEYFVPSLERICDALQLTDDVAGATFSAAGSSAPELFTSLLAVFVTEDEVGVGTIVGSAVFNVLVIIGLSALLSGRTLQLDWRPLVRDSAFYTVFVIFLLVQVLWLTTGEAAWWEGLIMLSLYSLYIAFMAFGNTRYMRAMERFLPKTKQEELAEEPARFFGCIVGIPAAVLGVTVLAAGTSVPDALASVSVARAGKGDFAVSNALGSNCFDVGIGLGAPWFLGGLILGRPQIIPTEPITAIVVPVIILFGVLSSLLGLLFIRKWKMGPLVGWVLISGYVVFVAYSLIDVYVIQG